MGILSTFCVAAASLVVDRVGSAEKDTFFRRLYEADGVAVFVGSGSLVAAGLCFYLQRSRLAHFYGGISMNLAETGNHKWTIDEWLKEAYSWHTWLRYRTGFTFLMFASVVYSHAIYRTVLPDSATLNWLMATVLGLIAVDASCRAVVLSTHRYKNEPYKAFRFRGFLTDWRSRASAGPPEKLP